MNNMFSGFHSVGLHECSILTAIEKIAAAGYKAIELNAETLPWAKPHVMPETPSGERAAIAAAAKQAGLTISAVGAHVPMVDADSDSRKNAINFVEGCIQLAIDVGAPLVHILSGEKPTNVSRDDAWRWFADAVASTTERAGQGRVSLAIEAIVGHLFHSVADYRQLSSDLPGVPFKINFDPSHLVVQGEDPARIVEEHGGNIVHVHMKDGNGLFPDFTFPPLGKGKINFSKLISGLTDVGYRGACSIEYEAQVFGYKESEQTILDHGRKFLSQHGVA